MLGLPLIEPELRENRGEIGAARKGTLLLVIRPVGRIMKEITYSPGICTPGFFRIKNTALTMMAIPRTRESAIVPPLPIFPPARPRSTGPAKESIDAIELTRATPEARRPGGNVSSVRTKNGAYAE